MNTTVAFQGELGAYSELAAREFFEHAISVRPVPAFEGVFDAVTMGECPYGIIPIENSLTGSIHRNYDLLLRYDLVIVGEIKLRISHSLVVNRGIRLEEIRRVYSHPQALAQCDAFIASLGNVEAVPVYDTAGAAKMMKEQGIRDGAAIASAQAAVNYGLDILARGIETDHQNYTRFFLLSRTGVEYPVDAKTSIVYTLPHVPGSLFKSLSVFALREINLLKIESRPLRQGKLWEYLFYLDFEGGLDDERCVLALEELNEVVLSVRVLGSYPKGRETEGRV
jgi:prephenate dehydratase